MAQDDKAGAASLREAAKERTQHSTATIANRATASPTIFCHPEVYAERSEVPRGILARPLSCHMPVYYPECLFYPLSLVFRLTTSPKKRKTGMFFLQNVYIRTPSVGEPPARR